MKTKYKDELAVELNGVVNLVERRNKKVKRYPIDSEVVVKILALAVEDGIDLMVQNLKLKDGKYDLEKEVNVKRKNVLMKK